MTRTIPLHAITAGAAEKLIANLGGLEEVEQRHFEDADQPVGQFRPQLTRSFQNIMNLRLGNAKDSRQPSLGKVTILNAGICRLYQSMPKNLKRDSAVGGF